MNGLHAPARSAQTTLALAALLPALSPARARLDRLVCDHRFLRWANALLPHGGLRLAPAAAGPALLVTLGCLHGEAELSADPQAWPALALAAQCGDAEQASDLASLMLAEPLACLQQALPGQPALQLRGLRCGRLQGGWRLVAAGFEIGLHAMDEGLASEMSGLIAQDLDLPAAHLRRLALPARISLFNRELSLARLRGLKPGDVVLGCSLPAAGRPLPTHALFGWGITMQATADLDLAGHSATLSAPLRAAPEAPTRPAPGASAAAADDGGPPLQLIGEMNLPITFELDSARISLDELASLGPGAVLPLPTPAMDAQVLLVCLGQVLGRGQLVLVGDRLGVRISRMGTAVAAHALQGLAGADRTGRSAA